jgi:tRNA uridine 5-carbamoylmethylation protein Kti12
MLLVSSELKDKAVIVDDTSQYSGSRIHLVFENSRLKELEPSTTTIFLGGG